MSDVHMPRANGWDVLSAVKADPALRFVPVVLITADDVFVNAAANEDLGAARVVAKSTLRGDDLATLARAVAGPSLALADALESPAPLRGELGSLVPAQVLGALARARLTGRVVVETAAGRRYELHIADAALIAAWVYANGDFATHIAAVLAQLLRERDGKFSVVREQVDGRGPLLVDLIGRLDEDDPSVETQPPTEDPVRTDQRRYDLPVGADEGFAQTPSHSPSRH